MARISAHHKDCQGHGKILPNKFTIFNQKASELEKVEREVRYFFLRYTHDLEFWELRYTLVM